MRPVSGNGGLWVAIGRLLLSRLSASFLFIILVPDPCEPQHRFNSLAGPFRIIPGHLEKCPAELNPKLPLEYYYHGVRDRHNQDLWYYTGNFTTRFTFDDDQTADVNVASWSARGGWKDNAFIISLPRLCSGFRMTAPQLWRGIIKAIHDDPERFCPFPPDTYVVRNVTTDFDIRTVPVFFYGKWRLTLRALRTKTKETEGCIRAFGETVPRERTAPSPGPGRQ